MKHIKRAAHKIKAAGIDPAAVSPIVYNLYRPSARCFILDKNTNRWFIYYEGGSINNFKDLSKFKEIILNDMFKVSKSLNYILPDMPEIIYVPPVFYITLEEIKNINEDKLQD